MPPRVGSRHSFTLGVRDAAGVLHLTEREPYRFRPHRGRPSGASNQPSAISVQPCPPNGVPSYTADCRRLNADGCERSEPEDAERKADKLSLQLDNFDLSLFDREDLMGGATLEVSWGYPGNMAVPRRVVVKKLKGFTTLTVEGQATSVLMNREAKTRSWENVTRAEVARQIAEEHGYEGELIDVDDTEEVFDVINQSGETDARFLRRLAAREEFEFYVDDGGFHFHERRQSAAPTHVFTWFADPGRGDVMSINVESDLVKRAGRVTVRGRDPMRRATIESTASNETADRSTLAKVVEVVDPETGSTSLETRNATATVHPTSASTEGRARRESAARFRRAERATVKLSMRVVGDPTLHAKSIVEVRGVSGLLSGKYYVTAAGLRPAAVSGQRSALREREWLTTDS